MSLPRAVAWGLFFEAVALVGLAGVVWMIGYIARHDIGRGWLY